MHFKKEEKKIDPKKKIIRKYIIYFANTATSKPVRERERERTAAARSEESVCCVCVREKGDFLRLTRSL